jgi:inorganic phosphate transporter, PiT family
VGQAHGAKDTGEAGVRYARSAPDDARPASMSAPPSRDRSIENVTLSLVVIILLAIAFDYINGFHDTANAIATSVATRALRPQHALLMATAFNFIGAFAGTAVAKTIGAGLVNEETTTQAIVAASLIGAITWNLITWWLGLPSSSSHALIGGLLGATVVAAGFGAINVNGVITKVIIPLISSPVLGFVLAFLLMIGLSWTVYLLTRRPDGPDRRFLSNLFRRLQIFSAAFMAFAHGSNDAQKTMGIITLALFSAGVITTIEVPFWVIVVSATALSLGTAVGGWRIMETMGHRVVELEPIHGFAAETTAASIIYTGAHFGIPLSTTQVISSAIMGVGASRGIRGVNWGVARRILFAWVLTIPAAGLFGAVTWYVLNGIGFG